MWYRFRKGDFQQDGEQEVAEQAEKQNGMAEGPSEGDQDDGQVSVVEDSETAANARSMLKVGPLSEPCSLEGWSDTGPGGADTWYFGTEHQRQAGCAGNCRTLRLRDSDHKSSKAN